MQIRQKKSEHVYQNSTFKQESLRNLSKTNQNFETSESHYISEQNLNDSDKIGMNGRSAYEGFRDKMRPIHY